MVNQIDTKILEEGYRNATVRIAASMDTSNVVLAPAIQLSQFVANDPNYTRLAGLRVDWIQFTCDTDIVVWLYWNSAAPQLIASVSDSNSLEFRKFGGLQPNMLASGYDGSINLSTAGYTAGNTVGFTVVMTFVKIYTP